MKTPVRILALATCLTFIVSCGSTQLATSGNTVARAATNTPEAFVPKEGITLDTETCKSPLFDPRDGTQITLERSANGLGNYSAPEGKYGLNKGEYLRIECSTGKVLGIVKK